MIQRLISQVLIQSWWVIAYGLFCFLLYEQGLQKRETQFQQLLEQLKTLQVEKEVALNKQKNLQLQVNSQSDLAWIELTLMKGLGLTPEDQQKIYFTTDPEDFNLMSAERAQTTD